jgi:enoyl-CoA hydratase/carnithine racemase
MEYETLQVSIDEGIALVSINRPAKANAMSRAVWRELRSAFERVDAMPDARVAIIAGNGAHFTSGIDLAMFLEIQAEVKDACDARTREKLRRIILDLQDSLTAIERCRKPVLAAIHGACIGGGVDLVSCCDMRYCSSDANFSIKEIDIGMTADVGTLQRLPRLIGDGMVRELAYTGRSIGADEALRIGLVNRVFESPDALRAGVHDLARQIAAKSPLAIRGTKEMLVYARDHPVADGLVHVAAWNAAMLVSEDLHEALAAAMQKRPAKFRD